MPGLVDFNVGPGSIEEAPLPLSVSDVSNENTQKTAPKAISTSFEDRTYQNDDIFAKKREKLQKSATEAKESYYNFSAIRAEVDATAEGKAKSPVPSADAPKHSRSQSLNEVTQRAAVATGAVRKIPENLKLTDVSQSLGDCSEPSPSLSTCSGPYIPISECFSGSPVLLGETPATPLNSLDPRFYDTPRSHINIGLNLTDEQPYSPKRNNCTRWRRRWFTLKQGEFPGQYFLEYYTDKSCKKLKGTIDLDQCEQVDAGLCMERKFQHVFNVKTPNRIYYLAADSDEDMRFWVNCICKVCGLQDLSKVSDERQCYV
uniref:Uncharacterized protein n=1 Tax=Phlebotomus papatasi TaxID=29031 RepID=A0A1B0DLZ2_PHLPP